MEIMDIFDDDAFQATTITAQINKTPFPPQFLGSLGIFTRVPIRTTKGAVATGDYGEIKIIPTTPRGAPPIQQTIPVQALRSFETPRVAAADTIMVSELQNIMSRAAFSGAAFGVMLQDLASEIAFRMDGPVGLQVKMETTKERMRLGAISGIVLDADGSTLYDWSNLLGVSIPAEIDLNLDAASPAMGVLMEAVFDLKTSMIRAARLGNTPNVRIIGLCGDNFFKKLIVHNDVAASYATFVQTASAIAASRMGAPALFQVDPFTVFPWAGIEWVHYRGTDDNSTVAIDPDKCKFIIVAPGLFQEILAPGESEEWVNSPGLPVYARVIPDMKRREYVELDCRSYPMYVATRPDLLFSARVT